MKIKTRLQIITIFSLAIALAIGLVLFLTSQRVNKEISGLKIADEIAKGVFELNIITYEYLFHREERMQTQWQLRHDSLTKWLTGEEFKSPERRLILDRIYQNLESLKALFSQLVENYKRRGRKESTLSRELEERLVGQLLVKSQAMVSDASQLSVQSQAAIVSAQQRATSLIKVFIILIIAIMAAASFMFSRSVSEPIRKLHEGTEIIGAGNLNYKVSTMAKDEVGQLSRAFDQMTIQLKESFEGLEKEIAERKRTEEALRKNEEKYRTVADFTYDWEYWLGLNRNFIYVSPSCEGVSGYRPEEFFANPDLIETIVHPDDRHLFSQHLNNIFDSEKACHLEFRINTRSGEERWISHVCQPAYSNDGSFLGKRGSNRDVTDLKRAEQEMRTLQDQFRQSQKMEAIGSLAGGVAHDFNNLLTIIKGYGQLSLMELKEGDPLKPNIEEIQKAAERAAGLTRQLLAFSRRQVMEMRVLDPNTLLRDLDKMLRRIIGEDIELVTLLADDLGTVKADGGQIEQVVMNLAVNARDAMQKGGKLTIETGNVELDSAYARKHVAVKPGPYVMLSVSDTGVGMTPEIRERVFEPFFTTKEKGKGTGLGLSTVYGIVKQSGGNIWVYSEPGKGTTLKIYLPRVDEPPEEVGQKGVKEGLPRGSETVLVVEDEEEVRKLAVQILRRQGYTVLEASQGNEASHICEQHKGPIHLMVMDVVMPGMNGRELAKSLEPHHPEMKVLYMSGYTDNAIVHHGILEKRLNFIQKPFTIDGLLRKVREVLDSDLNPTA